MSNERTSDELLIAYTLVELCLKEPDKITEIATLEMTATGNALLLEHCQKAPSLLGKSKTPPTVWFTRGTSVAFLYFIMVADAVKQTGIPVITVEDIGGANERRRTLHRRELLDAEHFTGEDLASVRRSRLEGSLDRLDRPLIGAIVHTLKRQGQDLSPADKIAFLKGGIFINVIINEHANLNQLNLQ